MTRAFTLLSISQRFFVGLSESSSTMSASTLRLTCRRYRGHEKRFCTTGPRDDSKKHSHDSADEALSPTSTTSSDTETIASTLRTLPASRGRISVCFEHGLPTIVVPLPSRQENCQFTLRPVSDTVGSFCDSLKREDRGIEIAALYTGEGMRIASSTDIQYLLCYEEFRLRVNDIYYDVLLPIDKLYRCERIETGEKMPVIDDLKAMVASLHTVFNIDDFKVERERLLLGQLEEVELELKPLEVKRKKIDEECARYSQRVLWCGFLAMGLQTGVFARLTFYEYSWDIMEPVTYFATFSTIIATFAYYLLTNQDFEYAVAHRRIFSRQFHRRARVHKFDIRRYNELSELSAELRRDLERLRDPLFQHLPASRLQALESERAKLWILKKSKQTIG